MKLLILKHKADLIVFSLFLILSINIQTASASTNSDQIVPKWIKNNAAWWTEGKISDDDFINGMRFLIENRILPVTQITGEIKSTQIPDSVKRTAYLWSQNDLPDSEFLSGVEYLIKNGIMELDNEFVVKITKERLLQMSVDGDVKKSVVIIPIFTAAAYTEPGFDTYFRGQCDSTCLTTIIIPDVPLSYMTSQNAVNVLQSLGYDMITDIDVDKNPKILSHYDKVIVLHNEYVTQKEFNAITTHPHVIYLYPNSLYSQINANYDQHTITLVRGHQFPESNITNGFYWIFDNSPMEYDTLCDDWKFNTIKNGIMLNCYPENHLAYNISLLKAIKEF